LPPRAGRRRPRRVLGERLERLPDPALGLLVGLLDPLTVEDVALPEDLPVADQLAAIEGHGVAILEDVEQRRAWHVHELHAAVDEDGRPAVRVVGRDRRRHVHHVPDAAGDQVLTRDAVDAGVVDDRHVVGPDPLDESLGALAEAGGAGERGLVLVRSAVRARGRAAGS